MVASPALLALVAERAPHRPWCGQTKNGAHIRSKEQALTEPYLQLNPPCLAAWLLG